jgi:hypothetical protein
MRSQVRHSPFTLLEYDAIRRRVWILGQRCHHGATGSFVAAAACVALIVEHDARSFVALAATGGLLMAHDWNDHALWFERGVGSQA